VAERPDDFRFPGYSGLVVLTASLSEPDPERRWPRDMRRIPVWLVRALHGVWLQGRDAEAYDEMVKSSPSRKAC
jgi:hypothetical protein